MRKVSDLYMELIKNNKPSGNKQWQSVDIEMQNPIVEINNIYLSFPRLDPLAFDPDLPWAEEHFKERVSGKDINPGNQYINWPYYKQGNNDKLFRDKGIFSHNYMERYWCRSLKGRRYRYGDLRDIIERLKQNPYNRQSYLSVWHPEDQSNNNVRVPCTLGYWFNVADKKLNMTYHIRSCDAVRHFRNDLYMSYRLLQHVANKINLDYNCMDIWIGSFHCFKSDLYHLKKYVRDTDNI